MSIVRFGVESVGSHECESVVAARIHLESVIRSGLAEGGVDPLGLAGNDIGIEFSDAEIEFGAHFVRDQMGAVGFIGCEIGAMNRGRDGDAVGVGQALYELE